MASDTRKRISASEAVKDIRSGMTDADLREKYGLPPHGLPVLLRKLADAGLLERHELERRQTGSGTGAGREPWNRPSEETPIHGKGPEGAPDTPHPGEGRYRFPEMAHDESADAIPEVRRMERAEWTMVLVTPLIAMVCFAFFWPSWILATFKILSHEMGHAIFGWVFGYPSFPQFDIIYGGGLTRNLERNSVLLIAIYVGLGLLAYRYRNNRAMLIALIVAAIVHAIFSYTSIHSIIILFMGHGTELIIGGLFIFRCLSGRAVVHPAERPLYGVIGFFIVFYDLHFAYGLLTSTSRVEEYLEGKGDLDNDFVRIAQDYLHVNMSWVVFVFLMCCLLCLLLSFLAFRYMEYLHAAIAALLARKPDEAEDTIL